MSSEERLIRPYTGLDRLSRALQHSYLLLANQRIDVGSTERLAASEFLSYPVSLCLAQDETSLGSIKSQVEVGLEQAALKAADVGLVVIASTPRLKLAEILWRSNFGQLEALPRQIDLTHEARPGPLQTPFGGCRIDVYLCLAHSLDQMPLRPWRKGTWLAHARFEIRTDLGDVGFIPLPLGEKERKEFGLPAATVRHIVIENPFASPEADAVQLYLDEEILNHLARQPSALASKVLQRQLFVDAMTAVIHEASRSADLDHMTWGDLENTIVGQLISRLVGATNGPPCAEHKDACELLAREVRSNPVRIVGLVEATVPQLRSSIIDMIIGEAS